MARHVRRSSLLQSRDGSETPACSGGHSLFQSIVIVLVSVLVLGGLLGAMWASWGLRFAR